ncbi:MAG: hypothetical protein AAGH15_09320 [Myxococcota bacterium]
MKETEPIRPALKLAALGVLVGLGAVASALLGSTSQPAPGAEDRARLEERRRAPRGRAGDGIPPGGAYRDSAGAAATAQALDPQERASQRFLRRQLDAGVPAVVPQTFRLQLEHASGDLELPEGETCELRLLPVRTARFSCLARVRCGDAILYPDGAQRAGYVRCEGEGLHLRASDEGTTPEDGDPRLAIDLWEGSVLVSDEGRSDFSARLSWVG